MGGSARGLTARLKPRRGSAALHSALELLISYAHALCVGELGSTGGASSTGAEAQRICRIYGPTEVMP